MRNFFRSISLSLRKHLGVAGDFRDIFVSRRDSYLRLSMGWEDNISVVQGGLYIYGCARGPKWP